MVLNGEDTDMKINSTVKKETAFVLGFTFVLCAILQSVYLICGFFSPRALAATAVAWLLSGANFLLMGLTVQKALEDTEENAKKRMKASQSMRSLMMLVVLVVSILLLGSELPIILALLIPLLFPRVALSLRVMRVNKRGEADAKNDRGGTSDE